MKTPTLIVRLCGLYLLVNGVTALLQINRLHTLIPELQAVQRAYSDNFQLYAAIQAGIGLVAARYAGPLARLLTFDSEPKEKDISDQRLPSDAP